MKVRVSSKPIDCFLVGWFRSCQNPKIYILAVVVVGGGGGGADGGGGGGVCCCCC